MYCGGCYNVPFWRWFRVNQKFSRSVTCNDYSRTYLWPFFTGDFLIDVSIEMFYDRAGKCYL
jgi:hypothetical protein